MVTENVTRIEHDVQDYANNHYPYGTVTILAHGKETIAEAIKANNRFFITIYNTAHLLYSHDGVVQSTLVASYIPTQAGVKAKKHYQHRMLLASGFLESAKECQRKQLYQLNVFMLHQAVEQCCIVLIRVHLAYRSDIHNLYRQLRLYSSFSPAPIYFKSYYFELFSKPRYLLTVPGVGSKAPTLGEIIERENDVISFIIEKHKDDFSLELFKKAYTHYSKDLCDLMEKGFVDYLHTFFWDEGNPALGDVLLHGFKNVIAFDIVRDFKRVLRKDQYEKLVNNSLYYAPPYLPVYGFMTEIKRWPMEILTVMEFEKPANLRAFLDYATKYYPDRPVGEFLERILIWTGDF